MVTVSELLVDLRKRSVELWFEGDTLLFRAPKGVLREDDRALLMSQKAEVIRLLKQRAMEDIEVFPLAYSQQALWFIHQAAPENAAYHVAFSARICSEVDIEAFRNAVQALVDRHASLRTTYAVVNGELVQQVHGYMECSLHLREATALGIGELKILVLNAYREPFDLAKGPLLRAYLFVHGERNYILLLTAHHIACDGWAFMLLLDELRALYAGNRASAGAVQIRPRSNILGYVEWQRQMTESDTGEKLLSYWQRRLSGDLPLLNLPTDKPRPPTQTHNGATHSFSINGVLAERLKFLAREEGTTLFTILLAAFHVLLHRYTGQEDILVGTPTYGRNRAEFSSIVGNLINTVTLRGNLSGNPTFRGFLAQMRLVVLEAIEHQEYPFPLIVKRLRMARDLSRSPVYQSFFIFQKFNLAPDLEAFLTSSNSNRIDFGGIELEPFFIPQQEGQLELVLEMGESNSQLFGNFKYNTDLFNIETIEGMGTQFIKLLERITLNPELHLSELVRTIESDSGQHPYVDELLSELESLGVRISAEEGRLRIDAPKGVLSPTMRERISNAKADILLLLTDSVNKKNKKVIPLQKVRRDGPLCLSLSQERLWFLHQLEPDNIAYNLSVCLRMGGELRVDTLERSLSEIIRRHEILRTTFCEFEGKPAQVVAPPSHFHLQRMDLREFPEVGRMEEVRRLFSETTRHPFDLAKGPLFRMLLIQISTEDHFLIIAMHHIITDGWSFGILSKELESLYNAYSAAQASPLSDLPIQYADFARWQREWMQGEVLATQLSYWKEKLVGTLPVLQLPTDRPRPAVQTDHGSQKWFLLTSRLKEDLYRLSQTQGVTPFMTLLAVFKILLYRYTGQTDFAVGSPIANRNRQETGDLIGFFVNTLVLRTDLSGDPRFVDLLEKVKETTLDAYSHQDLPFEKFVEELRLARDLSYPPLFQVMFAFQNFPWTPIRLRGLTVTPVSFDAGNSMYDLTLFMWEDEWKGLSGRIEYNTDLFDFETIERMMKHFEELLKSAVTNPQQRLSELSFLTDSERHQILVEWNDTSFPYPEEGLIGVFEKQVTLTPGATAVAGADGALTYGALNRKADQLAQYLRTLDAGPNERVGVYIHRSTEMLVALLGTLKAGSPYIPLDPYFPKDRIEFMLQDSKCRILITQSDLQENLSGFSGRRICIDSDWDRISQQESTTPAAPARPQDVAYVIYTSGSTGKPKGVQIQHRALINFLWSMQKKPGFTSRDTILSVTTMSFDIFGLEVFLPLTTGGKVVIAKREDTVDGIRLAGLLKSNDVSVMQATPSTWRLLIESGWEGERSLKAICGGEAMPADLVGPLLDKCGELWNLYGPTETTIWSTAHRVLSKDGPILIGSPIANTEIYILDNVLQPVPIGVVGELHIGGEGLSPGYLDRPELTAEKFIPHPFKEASGVRIYKTGDLARYRADGNIEYLGRVDSQVKVRGFRIELGEIEVRMNEMEAIHRSVAAVSEARPGDQRLVGYYVPKEGSRVSVSDLRSYLHSKLPDYMVPQHFVELASIPLTPSGKIDRKALPKPDSQGMSERSYLPPRTELELAITAIWQHVLQLEKVGILDNFFELGGHSLLMVHVLSRIRELTGRDISMIVLFQYPTISSLSRYLDGAKVEQHAFQRVVDRIQRREEALMRQNQVRKTRRNARG